MTLLVGVVIGVVLGLTGAGGSVFAVPLLINFLGLSMQQAAGLSLGAVAISALFGVILKLRTGHIEWLPALVFACLGSVGAPLGSWVGRRVDEKVLLVMFAVLVVIVATRMWQQASSRPEETKVVRADREQGHGTHAMCKQNQGRRFQVGVPCVLGMSAGALSTGVLSGLFGVGGGFLIVPILLALTNISIRQAVATSLVVIACVGAVGFVNFVAFGSNIEMHILALLAMGGVVGMALGVFTSRYLAGPLLQKIFAILMFVILAVTLVAKQ
ncbi:MAG: sulfite exporter TauE/SafE family protein [Agarilytica sp.]